MLLGLALASCSRGETSLSSSSYQGALGQRVVIADLTSSTCLLTQRFQSSHRCNCRALVFFTWTMTFLNKFYENVSATTATRLVCDDNLTYMYQPCSAETEQIFLPLTINRIVGLRLFYCFSALTSSPISITQCLYKTCCFNLQFISFPSWFFTCPPLSCSACFHVQVSK